MSRAKVRWTFANAERPERKRRAGERTKKETLGASLTSSWYMGNDAELLVDATNPSGLLTCYPHPDVKREGAATDILIKDHLNSNRFALALRPGLHPHSFMHCHRIIRNSPTNRHQKATKTITKSSNIDAFPARTSPSLRGCPAFNRLKANMFHVKHFLFLPRNSLWEFSAVFTNPEEAYGTTLTAPLAALVVSAA